jgi:hypothetical protein
LGVKSWYPCARPSDDLQWFVVIIRVRAAKGSVCIKQGRLSVLSQLPGHPFAFEISMDEMAGKSEDAVQMLSVDNDEQLKQWLDWIEQTFRTDRRTSAVVSAGAEQPSGTPIRAQSFLGSLFPAVEGGDSAADPTHPVPGAEPPLATPHDVAETNPVVEGASEQTAPTAPTEPLPLPAMDKPLKPVARKPSKSSVKEFITASAESNDGPDLYMGQLYQQESAVSFVDPCDDPPSGPFSPASGGAWSDAPASAHVATLGAPSVPDPVDDGDGSRSLAEKLEAKLNARRQLFKPPNFKNLLNSNGFDMTARRSSAPAASASGAGSEVNSETESTTPSVPSSTRSAPPLPQRGGPNEARDATRAALNPSPLTEPIRLDTPEPSPVNGEGAHARRPSFTKSPARRRTSKKPTPHGAGEGIAQQDDVSRAHTPSPVPTSGATGAVPHNTHPLTRHLKILFRPTEPVRMGYLLKLDTSHAHEAAGMGQDVWLTQYVTLDVTTGMMIVYAEING